MSALETVVDYHERTKHHFRRLARSLGYLDWANQPHPFRVYPQAPQHSLDLSRHPRPQPYPRLYQAGAQNPAPIHRDTLSEFLRYSLALSAWKEAGRNRWSLRVNPSSGNLHPTEGYLVLGPTPELSDHPALYHYRPDEHRLEQRAAFSNELWDSLTDGLPAGSFVVGLGSIAWREAWKYGERAFRYCQHDAGHALAALRFAAVLCGWRLALVSAWSVEDIAALLGLDRPDDFVPEEPEEPELLAVVTVNDADAEQLTLSAPHETLIEQLRASDWHGQANRLSAEHVHWPIIDEVTETTRQPRIQASPPYWPEFDRPWNLPEVSGDVDARQIIQQRRSALGFDGVGGISQNVFLRMLARTLPGDHPPWDTLWWPPQLHLAVFVHRVEGLSPGLYFLVRDPGKRELLQKSVRDRFAWEKPSGVPEGLPLYFLLKGNARDTAKALSCYQDIAADGFFSLGMIAEFADSLRERGPWFYRHLHWESGVIGQVLYLEAEAAGVRSTGMGCYFDDPVHDVLGLEGNRFQSLYHFTVGMPVDDPRLRTRPPYPDTR